MKTIHRFLLTAVILVAIVFPALADEGMWLLDQLEMLPWKSLQKRGLQLEPADIRNMEQAVVILGGGTASFVSPEGLLLTNHHVAFSALQRVSSVEHNYIENGFYAARRDQEIPVPGYSALVPLYHREVTARILAGLPEDMDPEKRHKAIEKRAKEIENEAEAREQGLKARVVSMYSGIKYYLFVYREFPDVRLVYAPPRSIGEYGGDIDNWMWPRHTGDFAFLRVYASADGSPAEYAEENQPYHPAHFFPISSGGAREGDFTFILGYPGRTFRYRTSHSIAYNIEVSYPERIRLYQKLLGVLEALSRESPDYAINLAGLIKGLNNVLKNNQGVLEGFRKLHLLEKKKHLEAQLLAFVNARPELKERYGGVLTEIGQLYQKLYQRGRVEIWLGSLRFSRLPNLVYTAYRYAMEMQKPLEERNPDYDEKTIKEIIRRTRYLAKQHVVEADRRILKLILTELASFPPGQQPAFLRDILGRTPGQPTEEAISQFVDQLFEQSRIRTLDDALALFDQPYVVLAEDKDPMLQFARMIHQDLEALQERQEAFSARITDLRSRFVRALFAWKGEKLYPDANRTLRFTYGDVRGYRPRDAVIYLPLTTLTGVVEKHTGEEPFNAPAQLLKLAEQKDYGPYLDPKLKDVPVNFLHTTDITGGNSGSPVLNGRGELIGCAFDGNYEAMTSDYQFDERITRTISVDSRYILFILDKFSRAHALLNELGIVPQKAGHTGE